MQSDLNLQLDRMFMDVVRGDNNDNLHRIRVNYNPNYGDSICSGRVEDGDRYSDDDRIDRSTTVSNTFMLKLRRFSHRIRPIYIYV